MTRPPPETSEPDDAPSGSSKRTDGPETAPPRPRKRKSLLTHATRGQENDREQGSSPAEKKEEASAPRAAPTSGGKSLLGGGADSKPSSPSTAKASASSGGEEASPISKPKGRSLLSHTKTRPGTKDGEEGKGGLKRPAPAPELGSGNPSKLGKRTEAAEKKEAETSPPPSPSPAKREVPPAEEESVENSLRKGGSTPGVGLTSTEDDEDDDDIDDSVEVILLDEDDDEDDDEADDEEGPAAAKAGEEKNRENEERNEAPHESGSVEKNEEVPEPTASPRKGLLHKSTPEPSPASPPKDDDRAPEPTVTPAPSPAPSQKEDAKAPEPASGVRKPMVRKPVRPEPVEESPEDDREMSSSPALTDTLRRIHAREAEGDVSPVRGESSSKTGSTLPEAMARLNRENRFKERMDRALGDESGKEGAKSSQKPERTYVVDDPTPGAVRALGHFVFLFGRFANGIQLAQPGGVTVAFLGICALGMTWPLLPWMVPDVASPLSIVNAGFLVRVLGLGLAGGLVTYVALSLLFNLAVRARFGRVGLLFGLRVVTAALLPLALVQVVCLVWGGLSGGEAFWRGAPPEAVRAFQAKAFPILWAWGGLRLAQAVVRMVRLPPGPAAGLFVLTPLLFAAAALPQHPAWRAWRHAPLVESLEDIEHRLSDPDRKTMADVLELEADLPFRAGRLRRRLYLAKVQLSAHLNPPERTRVACRQLEFASPPETAAWHLARGLNLHFYGKRPEWVEKQVLMAVERDPDLPAARKWAVRILSPEDPEAALPHARRLFALSDTPHHFALYLELLGQLDRHEDIWEAMLATDRPPEEWPVEALRLGAGTAERLGHLKRAERLRQVLVEKQSSLE